MKVVIVGGVAGGASCAARLRRLMEGAEIVLIERGAHISFANCGLPYYVGGEIESEAQLLLQTPESFHARFDVDVRVNSEVVSIDRENRTVTVRHGDGEYLESYDKLVLSPGAAPIVPPVSGADLPGVFTLRSVPDAARIKEFIEKNKPRRAVVVGGGFIGLEMAENLVRQRMAVTIVEMADQLLPPLDPEMAAECYPHLARSGIELLRGAALEGIAQADGHLLVTAGGAPLEADLVILSIGVRPESALAGAAGLPLGARGLIQVDEHMVTSDSDILAVGDAVQVTQFVSGQQLGVPLAGPANRQGRVAADAIAGLPSRYEGTQGSAIVKLFDLTIAMTGINEKTARQLGLDYEKSYSFSLSHAGYYPGGTGISIKTLFERGTGRILGAQLVGGEGVDKRCDVMATVIRLGGTARDLARLELCYAPPYSSAKDPVNMAGFAIENVLDGRIKLFHWHDVDALPRDGSCVLLDVRTEREYAGGHIEGFINIPLDELRARAGELPGGKPVYVHCLSGMRSYVACCMLSQMGHDCYNLSGGWRMAQIARGVR